MDENEYEVVRCPSPNDVEVRLLQRGEASATLWWDHKVSVLVAYLVEYEGGCGVEFKNKDDALAFCDALKQAVLALP